VTEPRRYVRQLDGRLVLTTQGGGDHKTASRPLTLRERIAWRLARRTPRR
jgi:hypothetical protein